MQSKNPHPPGDSVIARLELRRLLPDVVKKAAESSVKEATRSVLSSLAGSWTQAVLADTISALGGAVAVSLLKALLKTTDQTQTLLNAQMREPFITGNTQISEALELSGTTRVERQFRQGRLLSGVENLDHALTLSKTFPNQEQEQFLIHLLQGLAYSQISGAKDYATKRLKQSLTQVNVWLESAQVEIQRLERRIPEALREAQATSKVAEFAEEMSSTFGGRPHSLGHRFKAMRLYEEAEKGKKRVADLSAQIEDLNRLRIILEGALKALNEDAIPIITAKA
jgi:hypothetical protein